MFKFLIIELAITHSSRELINFDKFVFATQFTAKDGWPKNNVFVVIEIDTSVSSRKRHD